MAECIVLGSGTGVPSLRRGSPGLLILSNEGKILIDSGSGSLRRLLEAGVTYRDLDFLLFTHLHPDHTSDLVPFLFAARYGIPPRERNLYCGGGPGFPSYWENLNRTYGEWIQPHTYPLTLLEMSSTPLRFGNIQIEAKTMAHSRESVGYRISLEHGKTISVSGDTEECPNAVVLGMNADLLVLECSFPDEKRIRGHLTPSLAGRIGTAARCKTLLLTHLYPECDDADILGQCRSTYRGDLLLAEDFLRIPL